MEACIKATQYLIISNGVHLLLPVPCPFMMAPFVQVRKDLTVHWELEPGQTKGGQV
jgi:hypothetical protein